MKQGSSRSIFRARDLVDTLLTDDAPFECGAGVMANVFQRPTAGILENE